MQVQINLFDCISEREEREKDLPGVNFSLFGETSTDQEENSSNFFSLDFGGSSSHGEENSSSSGGFFSLFGSDPKDSSDSTGTRPNFKLF